MADVNDYDENEDTTVDDEEAKAAEKGGDAEDTVSDADMAEAETLTVTAKQKQRQALEDEVAAFLARGGKITEVPPDADAED
ncbi:hypothetical protein [Acinetobacter gerneri]|jgi:hypothetical protein|uniref:Transcriptional regulator SutA RNAP-binding domain-containing protein n=2 Tax=Acinetobacter gerneri TaxID=202952 RepID=N8ZP57_9GAMM|nr:hypothetical protein [Acinetobacter gerneri]ENV33528.1 hypothetical protein F960_02240 [Acinetobacter gerneri DSM 14967 = CIP 107464 = MTCC 9824]EPR80929.1 hypothetical protein L289_4104 [Acinetobacter gerneri DSM 14967 = CIP 107464 = MTCC 9824]MCH4244576.1 hypothetical protein [Acinetobacter gerneri]MDQ9010561.1 hypothetical protein [Acinetobacter gerneri]MDQ9014760.1 hypothetical protein [Acinetobacter gerneri]